MTTQLTLLPADTAPWHLDEATRETGRRGLAQARAALARADNSREANLGSAGRLLVAA
jgi:hypothetical protein